MKKYFYVLLIISLPIGFFIGFLVNHQKSFFGDELILQGKTLENKPYVINLQLNRKKHLGVSYLHYYSAYLSLNNSVYTSSTNFYSSTSQVKAKGFIKEFENNKFTDLSAREKYTLKLNVEGKDVIITADDLNSDFIVRNTPEYTKYISIGKALVSLEDSTSPLSANTAVEKIYSNNYNKYVFPKGYESLKPETDYLAFWDKKNDFYLIDSTKISEANPDYPPHTWVLHKKNDGTIQKKFEANVVYNKEAGQWQLNLPELNLNNTVLQAFDISNTSTQSFIGRLEGKNSISDISPSINGFFIKYFN